MKNSLEQNNIVIYATTSVNTRAHCYASTSIIVLQCIIRI